MSITLPVERAEHKLQELLDRLNLGDTVTLVGSEGVPQALLVSLKPTPREPRSDTEWESHWDALAQQVTAAWGSEKSAIELLGDMRR